MVRDTRVYLKTISNKAKVLFTIVMVTDTRVN